VPGYGDERSKIMFIGEAPGYLGADQTGIPFTRDKAGKLFQRMIIELGFSNAVSEEDEKPIFKGVYVTNIVKCCPKIYDKKGKARNRKPTNEERDACKGFIDEEMNILKPVFIVPMGKTATSYVLGNNGDQMEYIHGKLLRVGGRNIIPIYHPSARCSLKTKALDFKKVFELTSIR